LDIQLQEWESMLDKWDSILKKHWDNIPDFNDNKKQAGSLDNAKRNKNKR
jgi:hypothetical protein